MLTEKRLLDLACDGLLAEVLGFETREIARAACGTTAETCSGRRYLDFTAGIAVHACGHNHPEIVRAVAEQSARLLHVSDVMFHPAQLELAGRIRDLLARAAFGDTMTLLFVNSGSEAIEAAAKLAMKATGRYRFVAFDGAFHGRTLFASALSRSRTLHWDAYEGLLKALRGNVHHAPAPRAAGPGVDPCAEGLERLLDSIGAEVAAIFFEPQQGEGGYWPMAPETARRIRALADRHGILLVADEIQTGWGRTGRWFGSEHLGIRPDILVFGKALGGGLPLACVAAPRSVMDRWAPGEHGTTFGGNPVACAAGLAALGIVECEGLVGRASRLGEAVKARLCPLVGTNGVVDIRGNGLMIGVELRDASGTPDYARCCAVKARALERGLLLLTCGARIGDPRADNATMRLIPPLNVDESDLDAGLAIFEAALGEA
jgi:4-aminobutyrate aminotransferase